MAPVKKSDLNPNPGRGSFGGQNQLRSGSQNQRFGLGVGFANSTRSGYADSEKSAGGPPSPTLASANLLFNDEEFPELGRASTSSSAAERNPRNPRTAPHKSSRRGSAAEVSPIVQTEVTDSPSPTLASGKQSLNNEEFPKLGGASTSSSAATGNPRNPIMAPQKSSRRGSAAEVFPIVQTEVTDSPLPTLASGKQSLNNEEFPELGGASTSSSAATGNPRDPIMAPQKSSRRGSAAEAFPIVHTEDTDSPLPTLAAAKLSLNDEEFPELGGAITSSSAAAGIPRDPRVAPQKSNRRGSAAEAFPIVQTEDTVSTPSTMNATGFRKIHHRAGGEDGLPHRASAQGNRKGSARGQPGGYTVEQKPYVNRDDIDFLGRLLASILRHRAVNLNLQIRDDGYVMVNDLLKLGIKTWAGLPLSVYTVDDVMKTVERDNKQRFRLLTENDVLLIRANQGHSIEVVESDKLLKPILSPDEIPVCVHGTLMRNLDLILKTGLKKMGRNHVHFASGLPKEDGVISGMRFTSEVLIYLDSKTALQDGMKLYMSANGVILTEGFNGVVPPKYFAQVAKWSKGKIAPYPVDAKA